MSIFSLIKFEFEKIRPLKTSSPISVTEGGIIISFNGVHSSKAEV